MLVDVDSRLQYSEMYIFQLLSNQANNHTVKCTYGQSILTSLYDKL